MMGDGSWLVNIFRGVSAIFSEYEDDMHIPVWAWRWEGRITHSLIMSDRFRTRRGDPYFLGYGSTLKNLGISWGWFARVG